MNRNNPNEVAKISVNLLEANDNCRSEKSNPVSTDSQFENWDKHISSCSLVKMTEPINKKINWDLDQLWGDRLIDNNPCFKQIEDNKQEHKLKINNKIDKRNINMKKDWNEFKHDISNILHVIKEKEHNRLSK